MIGIIDEFGIESFIPSQGNLKQALLLIIRSKLNFYRITIFFYLDFTDKEINKIQHLVRSQEVRSYNEAGIIILEKLNSLNKVKAKTDKLLRRFYMLRDRLK